MTYQRFAATKLSTIELTGTPAAPAAGTVMVIDATGEKAAFVGQVWNKDGTTKNIRKFHLRFGTLTKAGGSGLTGSLQNVNLAAGPPYQPDETQDETVAMPSAGITANSPYASGNLSADRTVAFGEFLAVVVEFDGGGRLGTDSFTISGVGVSADPQVNLLAGPVLKTGGAWALVLVNNNVVLEFSDGTFGCLTSSLIFNTFTSLAYQAASTPDELALRFTVSAKCKVEGAIVSTNPSASADFDVVLYDGTTVLATVSVDANQQASVASMRQTRVLFPAEVELLPSVTYYLSVKPTSANTVVVNDASVASANHLQAFPQGPEWHYASRTDAGAWTAVTTRVPISFGLLISQIDDGASAGGGAYAHASMV